MKAIRLSRLLITLLLIAAVLACAIWLWSSMDAHLPKSHFAITTSDDPTTRPVSKSQNPALTPITSQSLPSTYDSLPTELATATASKRALSQSFTTTDENFAHFVSEFVDLRPNEILEIIKTPEQLSEYRTVVEEAFGQRSTIKALELTVASAEAHLRLAKGGYEDELSPPQRRPIRDEYVVVINNPPGGLTGNKIVRIYPGELAALDKYRETEAEI